MPRITLVLIAINAAAFLMETVLPIDMLRAALDAQGYGPRNWYNPFAVITAFFLHVNLEHIFFNMLFLWIFGAPLEERLGWKRYLVLYIGAGISSSIAFTATQFIFHGPDAMGYIGASGAVSGMAAMYIYRCYYAKLDMVIDPVLFRFKFRLPALPFVLFWFLKDVYLGLNIHGTVTGVAHWAHIGGFVFGIAAARFYRLGHEGMVENLREKVNTALAEGKGFQAVEKELVKIADLVPDEPDIMLDMARLYANTERPKVALRHYSNAINGYFARDPHAAAYTVVECAERLKIPMDIKYHLKAAEVMVKAGNYADARKVLLMALRQKLNRSLVIERALVLFAKVNWQLGKPEDAGKALNMLRKGFPKSQFIREVERALSRPQGDVFAPPSEPPPVHRPKPQSAAAKKADQVLGIMSEVMEVAMEPFFIFAWLATQIAIKFLWTLGIWPHIFGRSFYGMGNQMVIFLIALIATIEHRTDFFKGLMHHVSDRKARKDFDITRMLDNAMMHATREEFPRAAELYEAYLTEKPDDITARYKLARIYHKKLDEQELALMHYGTLKSAVGPGSPACMDAEDGIREIEASRSAWKSDAIDTSTADGPESA